MNGSIPVVKCTRCGFTTSSCREEDVHLVRHAIEDFNCSDKCKRILELLSKYTQWHGGDFECLVPYITEIIDGKQKEFIIKTITTVINDHE